MAAAQSVGIVVGADGYQGLSATPAFQFPSRYSMARPNCYR